MTSPCLRAGPVYFEYIGVGLPAGAGVDTTNQQATVDAIPVPSSGQLRFIVFVLSDQRGTPPAQGTSTGNFGPIGQYAAGGAGAASYWDPAQIGNLQARGKVWSFVPGFECLPDLQASHSARAQVMASLGGDTASATKWTGVNVATYVPLAVSSLMDYYYQFGLDGFDINYEESILSGGTCSTCGAYQSWLSAWSQIITQLKSKTLSPNNNQVRHELSSDRPFQLNVADTLAPQNGVTISFAPYSATQQAYKDLQNAMAALGSNVDFIIYQLYAESDQSVGGLTTKLTALQSCAPLSL